MLFWLWTSDMYNTCMSVTISDVPLTLFMCYRVRARKMFTIPVCVKAYELMPFLHWKGDMYDISQYCMSVTSDPTLFTCHQKVGVHSELKHMS